MATVTVISDLEKALSGYSGKWSEKKGLFSFSALLAQRKVFLSTKTLTYSAKMRVDEDKKIVTFSEMLVESGSGLSSGDDGMSTGFGFQTETYNTFSTPRPNTMQEQSVLFGKKYSYRFDHNQLLATIKDTVEKAGYKLVIQVLPVK